MRWGLERDLGALEQRLVWIVGSPRTGSTWLVNLLVAHPEVRGVDEPLIGAHLGFRASAAIGAVARSPGTGTGSRALDVFQNRDDYFFSDRYADAWRGPLRRLILARLLAQLRDMGGNPRRDTLFVKEPNGSEATDVLAAVLPRSRFLIVVRDGRDVVDSMLDAVRPGAWASSLATLEDSSEARLRFVDDFARLWLERMEVVLRTRDRIEPERAHLVRYEDLLADPAAGVRGIYAWLGLAEPDALAEHVQRLSFAGVAAADRGSGKFHRAATPGLWRQNLSAEEQAVVNSATAPVLRDLGYEVE